MLFSPLPPCYVLLVVPYTYKYCTFYVKGISYTSVAGHFTIVQEILPTCTYNCVSPLHCALMYMYMYMYIVCMCVQCCVHLLRGV